MEQLGAQHPWELHQAQEEEQHWQGRQGVLQPQLRRLLGWGLVMRWSAGGSEAQFVWQVQFLQRRHIWCQTDNHKVQDAFESDLALEPC
jgi:hypothetical protein